MRSRMRVCLSGVGKCASRAALACLFAGLAVTIGSGEALAATVERGDVSGTRPRARYNGETIFRGLIFGIGPVARLVPEIWDTNMLSAISAPEMKEKWAEVTDRVVTGIRTRDAGFFDRFAEQMQSGDQVTIDQGFREAAGLITEVATQEFGAPPPSADGAGVGQCVVVFIAVFVAANAIFALNAVAQYNLAIFVQAFIASNVILIGDTMFYIDNQIPKSPSAGSGAGAQSEEAALKELRREMWIDLIAKRLGGAPLPRVLQSVQ